ncbi:MAG TPA: glutaconyl-CoA decarboxylase subunit beta [Lachnoclostridium sp.]|jgi:sodium ion-translocating decarboxylase beta subunit|uniref:sodium ion-translocating decarboxylase subunit beta n=1 Tax=Lacrimispora sp. TaxID=2719234 RepID=UPI000ECE7ED5|nr:sodium ion-translocating decarboxylase subunit beta [Lacrimispora sp.]HCD43165.1 glutaconyl-CoA decarboxylase subunit beta [Lachnoclostridium sp.]
MIVINYITNIISNITISEIVMIILALALAYMAVEKRYEPLLLLPLAFGMLIANISNAGLSSYDEGGLIYYLYKGIELGIYPPMIFICIGAMTDFSPLISSPKTALIGLGGQVGIFAAMFGALGLGHVISCFIPDFVNFTMQEAAAIGVIGSSDGPTSIYITKQLASHLLPTITIAAYSYMALVPLIQPPIMRALTTHKERMVIMPIPKEVSRRKKLLFPIVTTLLVLIFVPSAATLIAMLMLGNLIRESGVAERLVRMLEGDLLNLLTLLIGLSIGGSATAERVLNIKTLFIIILGLFAFIMGTAGGVLVAKILCKLTGGKVNPLIGNAGVSAMPMAARISQRLGHEYNPSNHLLMHAMGPIVASTIGSAIIAGIFISMFG